MLKKNEKLLEMMNDLDDKYIEEAEKTRFLPQKNIWRRVSSVAASVALVAAICTFPIWGQFDTPEIGSTIDWEDMEGKELEWDSKTGVFVLKDPDFRAYEHMSFGEDTPEATTTTEYTTTTGAAGSDIESENKKTPNVLYPLIMGEYAEYSLVKGRVMVDKVGERLGEVTMTNDEGGTYEAELYAIRGIDTKCAVAVKYPSYSPYCIFYNTDATFATFAEFKNAYSLDTELYIGLIMVEHTVADNTDRFIEFQSIAARFKEKLLALDGVSCTYEEFAARCDMKNSIGFDVAQGAIWRSACAGLQIFEDGYLVTNLGGGILIFDIGKAAAEEMIEDAEVNRYAGFHFYDEVRSVLVDDTKDDAYTGALSDLEKSEENDGTTKATINCPYELTTPSYDPHSPAESTEIAQETVAAETTTAVPPYMPESTTDTYATDPLIYEGRDPYAMPKETTSIPD